jgi:hypothetical protein
MSTMTDLVDRYIASWNETDGARRRDLIAQTFTPNASYIDPLMQAEGHFEIDGMIRGVQEHFPSHRFRRSGKLDEHHNRIRFTWDLVAEGGSVVAKGTDFAVVDAARLAAVTGFIDQAPA